MGSTTLFLNTGRSVVKATTGNRPRQQNTRMAIGIAHAIQNVALCTAFTHGKGEGSNNVAGRAGKKPRWVFSGEYRLSRGTSAHVAAIGKRCPSGHALDSVNIAAMTRNPAASSVTGGSIEMRHNFLTRPPGRAADGIDWVRAPLPLLTS